jgi:hypothetical protein
MEELGNVMKVSELMGFLQQQDPDAVVGTGTVNVDGESVEAVFEDELTAAGFGEDADGKFVVLAT